MTSKQAWQAPLGFEIGVLLTPVLATGWLALILALLVFDQLRQLPPRPPTPAQLRAARPVIAAIWRGVYPHLLGRLEAGQPRPPELGAVWATRTGQICGLVDAWHTGVDVMTQFYTWQGRVLFRNDDERLYVRQWSRCIDDPYVVIHAGTLLTGACATRAGRLACQTARGR